MWGMKHSEKKIASVKHSIRQTALSMLGHHLGRCWLCFGKVFDEQSWEPRNDGRALQEVELGMEILQPQQAPLRADTSLGKGAVTRAAEWEHVFQLRIAEGSDISQSVQKRLKAVMRKSVILPFDLYLVCVWIMFFLSDKLEVLN